MPFLIELQYKQSIDFTLLPKFGLNTHIFYEEISFFQFFGLFGHIIRFNMSLNQIISSNTLYIIRLQ